MFRTPPAVCQVFHESPPVLESPVVNDIGGVALLDEPLRRKLYEYVARQPQPVGRDEAATATGATRENAAFHLDRLAEGGLLEVSFKRLSRRTGPGAGRPAKLYRRSTREIDVTIPARRYRLLAELLAGALDEPHGKGPRREVGKAARAFGAKLGAEARARAGARRSPAAILRAAMAVLDEYGFEPAEGPRGSVRLRNCPFDALARRHRDLVCGMNLSLMEGVLAGLDAGGASARLDPQPGMCCVALTAGR